MTHKTDIMLNILHDTQDKYVLNILLCVPAQNNSQTLSQLTTWLPPSTQTQIPTRLS